MGMKFTNNATSTLAAGITNVSTSLTVATGQGALFPSLGAGDYFYCTLANLAGSVEVIKVTARTGDTFGTIVRAQDGTTALSWSAGDKVELRLVSASLNDIPKLDENNVFSGNNTLSGTTTLGTLTGLLKGTTGAVSSATADTDYSTPSGTQKQTYTAYTTGGTSSAYTLTPTPAISSNLTNLKFRVNFNAVPTGSPTLSVSGQAALNLKYRDNSGTKQFVTAAQIPAIGWVSDVENDGVDWVVVNIANSGPSSFGYFFTDWNPTNLAGGNTPPPSTGTSVSNNGVISGSNSAGTLTISFAFPGKYKVSVNYSQAHSNTYTTSILATSLGGTATRYISPSILYDQGQPNPVNSNSGGSATFLVSAAASQTVSVTANFTVTGAGTTANHTASLSVAVSYLGA